MMVSNKVPEPEVIIDGGSRLAVNAADRGLAYGDGVFETCRVVNATVPLLDGHIKRLLRGLSCLSIPIKNKEIERKLKVALSAIGNRSGTLKIIVTRGTGGRGYALPALPEPCFITLFYPDSSPAFTAPVTAARLWLCRMPLPVNPYLAGIKHLSRLENVMARAEFGADYDEGLLLNTQGEVIECTAHNLFIRVGDALLTPDLASAGVEGVMRQLIIEHLAPAAGLEVRQASFDLERLKTASEVFICNSNHGIRQVGSLAQAESGDMACWRGGDYSERLQQQLDLYITNKLAEEFVCALP
ncbi:MAG TPA: aminodeoxychorismate lyase [Cellvibrionaceae bacterium]